jgi:hypothetical protein
MWRWMGIGDWDVDGGHGMWMEVYGWGKGDEGGCNHVPPVFACHVP